MKLNEYQMSRSFFDLCQRSLRFQNWNLFFSETVGLFETKFGMKDYGNMWMEIYTNELGHMTISIYDKNLKKSSSLEPIDQWPWSMVCSIVYGSTTKVVHLGWPWPILRKGQICSLRLLYGKKRKLFIYWNYYSLRSQSWLKHSSKWVHEVKWISNVKVILWPLPNITQMSKLKLVFLRNSWVI